MFRHTRLSTGLTLDEFAAVRRTGKYRVAIWLARFAVVPWSIWMWIALTSRQAAPEDVMLGVGLAFMIPMGASMALFQDAGLPFRVDSFNRRRRRVMLKEDPRVYRQWRRDFFWYRRRLS